MDWLAVVAGGGVAVISSGLGARYGARLEDRRWLREQRREAYHEYMNVMNRLAIHLGEEGPEAPMELDFGMDLFRAQNAVLLLGPERVAALTNEVTDALEARTALPNPATPEDLDAWRERTRLVMARFIDAAARVIRTRR
jgi:hypothetical protein